MKRYSENCIKRTHCIKDLAWSLKKEFERLVQDPKAFQAKLEGFAKTEDGQKLRKDFIETALQYPNVSGEVLTLLANNGRDEDVLQEVQNIARNPNTPPETLTLLAEDPNWNVKIGVASNPSTPTEILTFFS